MLTHDPIDADGSLSTRLFTLPNAISVTRLLVAFGFPFIPPSWRLWVLIAGAASDWLDGLAAKLLRSQSTFGQLLDPLADKALFISALLTLALSREIEWWQIGLVLVRDVLVAIVVFYALTLRDWSSFKRMRPSVLGKVTTVLVFIWLGSILLSWAEPIKTPSFITACTCSALSAVDYGTRFLSAYRQRRANRVGHS